jgi:(1->4)-alpha-D-glucan 1-alpha-D-glucosylmutase
MLYQMLVGTWPIGLEIGHVHGIKQFCERIEQWLIKALREAKQVSDWVLPNAEYEAACVKFLHAILMIDPYNVFLSKLINWVAAITPTGIVKSLSQTVLRLTSPGIPDLYQGTDFWDFSMVDPDNRRPVDYARREASLRQNGPTEGIDGWQEGTLKQRIISNLLTLRIKEPDLFAKGDYQPLQVTGLWAENVIAFARRTEQRTLIVIATILPYDLLGQSELPAISSEAWKDTFISLGILGILEKSTWTEILTGRKIHCETQLLLLEKILTQLPLAVLIDSDTDAV